MNRLHEEKCIFNSFDGTELFYRVWRPESESTRAVFLLHRGHEHSGRVAALFRELKLSNCWGFAYDMRGHGQSPGERGYAENYAAWVKDLNAFAVHVRDRYGIRFEDTAVVANSVGAVNAVTWVHDYGVSVRCLVLAAPAFRIRLYVPFALPMLRLLHRVRPKSFIKSYVKSRMLTHDLKQAADYDADTLITRNIAVTVLVGMFDAATRVLDDAEAIDTPTLIFSAGSDYVVKNSAQRRFFDRIASKEKKFITYPNAFHALFYDTVRDEAIAETRQFIQARFDAEPSAGSADGAEFAWAEYERLRKPAGTLKNAWFGFQKSMLKSAGRLSDGIRTGWQCGFDSGESLDHVYQNRPSGKIGVGSLIDRFYLNAIGWRGIRRRKDNLQAWLKSAVDEVRDKGEKPVVMDIAAGPARYLIDFKHQYARDAVLLLRDNVPENLEKARALADRLGLGGVFTLLADAFEPQSYSDLPVQPNIVVVSGLWELFPDNNAIRKSLQGIVSSLPPGGVLIYTGQPWHPQIELIARTLENREKAPWIMRRRTQKELNMLVGEAGFHQLETKMGPYGIFTVSKGLKK